jgi:hypothetical protein
LRYGSVVGGNSIICPKCGSGNVVGLAGEWECFDCGYKFKVSTVGVRTTPLAPEAGKPPVEKAKPILDRRAEQAKAFRTSMMYGQGTSSSPIRPHQSIRNFKIVGLVGFFLSLLSLALPWMEVSTILGLSTTTYGFSTDGVISFILLLVCLGLILTRMRKWKTYVTIFLSIVALAITAAAVLRVSEIIKREAAGIPWISVSWGPGAPLMIVSCLIFIVAAIMMYRAIKSSQ